MELTDKLIALLKRGTPVYGTIQKSFSKNDALEILEECLKSRITVFGGDVVEYKNNYFEHNYDNWSCERKKNESAVDYALRSAKRAIKYILEYKKDNAYFILVLDVKDETIKQHLFFNEMIL
jgi:hypothetical protein